MVIPKIIFQIGKKETNKTNTWKIYNPDFIYYLYSVKKCKQFILKYFKEYLDLYYIDNDIIKYLLLYKYGGIYTNINTECYKSIDPLLNLFPNSIITTINGINYINWFIACPKNLQIMLDIVEEIKYRYKWFVWNNSCPYTYILKNSNESIAILDKGKLNFDKYIDKKIIYVQFCHD